MLNYDNHSTTSDANSMKINLDVEILIEPYKEKL